MLSAAILFTDARTIDNELVALMEWREGETLIEYVIGELQAAGIDVIEVIVDARHEPLIAAVARDNVEPVINVRPSDDIAAALRLGAQSVPRGTEAAMIVRVSEPRPREVYRLLLASHRNNGGAATRAAFEGARGTPFVVDARVLAGLRNVSRQACDLSSLIEAEAGEVRTVALSSPVATLLIETAEDLERARAILGATSELD